MNNKYHAFHRHAMAVLIGLFILLRLVSLTHAAAAPCGINHAFVLAKAQGADATIVGPNEWNADHNCDANAFGPTEIDETANYNFTGTIITTTTVASLGTATSGVFKTVTDGNPNCATGGGSAVMLCRGNGTTWDTIGPGDLTEVQGTANEIAVASGTGPVPVISLPTDIIRPTGSTLTTAGTGTIQATNLLGRFVPIQSNPILTPTGGETLASFGSFLKVGATHYAYYLGSQASINRATSTDGITWMKDTVNNPMLVPGAAGTWDADSISVPTVWKEDTTWYMLYGGNAVSVSRVGLATSPDGIVWTRAAVNNCTGTTGNGCVMDKGFTDGGTERIEPFGIIKVGSTYYLSIVQPDGQTRAGGYATSTNLTTWTKDNAANPTFTGGRYDPAIFKYGPYYYMIVPHYIGTTNTYSELELYRSAVPTFRPAERTFLGTVAQPSGSDWATYGLDTPFIYTDDIFRNSFAVTGGDLWMYYSGSDTPLHTTFRTGLAIASAGSTWATGNNNSFIGTGHVIGDFDVTGRQSNFSSGAFPVTIGGSGTGYPGLGYNVNFSASGGSYTYKSTDTAALLQLGEDFRFWIAPSGSAGNAITFTEHATLKATTGRFGLSQPAPAAKFHISASQAGLTTLGNARQVILDDTTGGVNTLLEIGFGYKGSGTYQPVVLGTRVTEGAGQTKGDFYIATRDATTDTAPTERFTISPAGVISGATINATTGFQINGGAASGNVLRGNGTDFVSAQLAFTDLSGSPAHEVYFEAATCNNVTATLTFNANTANVPAATCEGANTRLATADFDDTTDEGFDGQWRLPTGFTGAIDIIVRGKAAAITGAVGICFQMVRVPTGATSDPALPAQAAGNCVSFTIPGTTLQETEATITGVTCTSCVAGDRVNWKLTRDADGSAVTDSMTGDFSLLGFARRWRVTPQS